MKFSSSGAPHWSNRFPDLDETGCHVTAHEWHHLAWWKWIKRLRGIRWERWVCGWEKNTGGFAPDSAWKEYATDIQRAKFFLEEKFG